MRNPTVSAVTPTRRKGARSSSKTVNLWWLDRQQISSFWRWSSIWNRRWQTEEQISGDGVPKSDEISPIWTRFYRGCSQPQAAASGRFPASAMTWGWLSLSAGSAGVFHGRQGGWICKTVAGFMFGFIQPDHDPLFWPESLTLHPKFSSVVCRRVRATIKMISIANCSSHQELYFGIL